MWFPLPHSLSDLLLPSPPLAALPSGDSALPRSEIPLDIPALFNLLTSPQASEWKHKVGVVTPRDGSAKTTTRLLESGGWVFKTDLHQASPSLERASATLHSLKSSTQRAPVSHPDKFWLLLRSQDSYWPVSVCPTLLTLRSLPSWPERFPRWSQMIAWGWQISLRFAVGLDLNPSNFGFDSQGDRLYYIDDEIYAAHDLRDIADAIIGRLPEDAERSSEDWFAWGCDLRHALLPLLTDLPSWIALLDGLRSSILTRTLEPKRAALLDGLCQKNPFLDPSLRPRSSLSAKPRRTCIFSDVHANLPALNAILKEADKLGADHYLFLGDLVGYGPFPHQCVERLQNLPRCRSLRGNHDQMAASGEIDDGTNRLAREAALWTHAQLSSSQRSWLLQQPLDISSPPWLAVHGAPQDPSRIYAYVYELTYRDNLHYLREHNYSACFYGHSHVQFIYRLLLKDDLDDDLDEKISASPIRLFQPREILLLNPGSVGQPRDRDPRAGFALWDHETDLVTFHRIAYPIHVTTEAILRAGLPEDIAFRLEMGW